MWLKELRIKNFRKIENLTVSFPRGLCVVVGENNTGKTAIIDALRLILISSRDFDALRINEDDFRNGTDFAPIEISCMFTDLNDKDEVRFVECLVDVGGGNFDIQLNIRAEFNKTTRRVNVKSWGGETEGGILSSILYDSMAAIYLQPLRDPESGLRPGRYSQVSRLIDCLTKEAQYGEFEAIAKEANDKIRKLKPVEDARNDINSQMISISGEQLAQNTELIFSDPTFYRIIAGLQPEIDGLPFALNGLGYNNLIFTSATLGTLQKSSQLSFRSILIEEPEAHLHPQLQVLLLRYLAKVTRDGGADGVQVIVTSHSPILASQAPIDSIVSIHEHEKNVNVVSISSIGIDAQLKKKLQRFLDTTRAELFFARRILMVEGISEALLLPALTKIAGGCLKESAVSVLNVDGLNFNAFLPLFGEKLLCFPVAMLTDGDAASVGSPISAAASGLKAKEAVVSNLRVSCSEITFEHELARSQPILSYMLDAFEMLHPTIGADLRVAISGLSNCDDKADAFLKEFRRSNTSKGHFSQELAAMLEGAPLQPDAVPEYIREALRFLGVIKIEAGHG